MWNVLGYCRDFANGNVELNEFKRIFKDQRPLNSFVIDCYSEVVNSKFSDEFYKQGGISVENKNYQNIAKFVETTTDIESLKLQIKLIIEYYLKINNQ